MSRSRKQRQQSAREHKRSANQQAKARARRQHATETPQRTSWLGDRRPVIAPKSNDLILLRMEHCKDEANRIPPRAERGCRVIALNGRQLPAKAAA